MSDNLLFDCNTFFFQGDILKPWGILHFLLWDIVLVVLVCYSGCYELLVVVGFTEVLHKFHINMVMDFSMSCYNFSAIVWKRQ